MYTKKDIMKWWEERGKIVDEPINDYKDFYDKINKNKVVIMEKQRGEGEKQTHELVIMRENWQHPLKLYFYNLENIRIKGF